MAWTRHGSMTGITASKMAAMTFKMGTMRELIRNCHKPQV